MRTALSSVLIATVLASASPTFACDPDRPIVLVRDEQRPSIDDILDIEAVIGACMRDPGLIATGRVSRGRPYAVGLAECVNEDRPNAVFTAEARVCYAPEPKSASRQP